jgi:hypothetical protein
MRVLSAFLLPTILGCAAAFAPVSAQVNPAIALEKSVFAAARKYADAPQATSALYRLIALGETTYRDTLIAIYFANDAYGNAVLLGRELLAERPDDLRLLEILAVSEQQLGINEEALLHYTTLYRKSKDVYFQYQCATLQYQLNKKGEAKLTIEDIIANKQSLTATTAITYENGQSQQVPVKAAALNLRGAIFADEDNEALAMNSFNEAYTLAEGKFKLAADNIAAIKLRIAKEAAENTAKEKAATESAQPATSPK